MKGLHLVIGASGFIGNALVNRLADNNNSVKALIHTKNLKKQIKDEFITLESWRSSPVSQGFNKLWLGPLSQGGGFASVIALGGIENFRDFKSIRT